MTQAFNNSLLIEFLTEELPPLSLEKNIGAAFAEAVLAQLNGFTTADTILEIIAAPRRFGCLIRNIKTTQDSQQQLRKGPAVANGVKDGAATPALLGFAKSCGVEWTQLQSRDDGYFYYEATQAGRALEQLIPEIIAGALKKIVIAKAMRWGDYDHQFVRPVHNLVVMVNEQVLNCEAFGLTATNRTRGHRFMAQDWLKIEQADDYFNYMKSHAKVIASFGLRREMIASQLQEEAQRLGLTISPLDGLLDEVTALVEWPEVLEGEFAEKFLKVPQECLILSMAKNQKYFALLDGNGKLSNKFLFVANLISHNPQVIIEGNQKVLTARLADAEFFYEFDKRTALADFVAKMGNVVYHNKLGSQLERVARLEQIAAAIAPQLQVDSNLAIQAAHLLKADLVTEMVGEFPELQGVMGKYYALTSGYSLEVANAIEKHYYPRFSGDQLPDTKLAVTVSLADKLETLVGIWGIGLIPTGDKDPYALRRAALGVVRILLEHELDLKTLLEAGFAAFAGKNLAVTTVSELYQFILQRLSNYLTSSGSSAKAVNAVISAPELGFETAGVKKLSYIPGLLQAVASFADNAANQSLFQANKRIENILKKNEAEIRIRPVTTDLLCETAEKELFNLFNGEYEDGFVIVAHKDAQNWAGYFTALTGFSMPLDKFFNEVMVMAEDEAVRQNRLNLLRILHKYFNLACNLTELA